MRDHEKTSLLDFSRSQLANLQQQLLKTRDSINKVQFGMKDATESLQVLQVLRVNEQ
jgi:hypothetical protein